MRGNQAVYGGPITADSAIVLGLTQLDSALTYVNDSSRVRSLAQVVKGRALLDLGRYGEAALAVTGVPLSFAYRNDGGGALQGNNFVQNDFFWNFNVRLAVGEREGGNGLPFVSAQDPRVRTFFRKMRYSKPMDSLYDQTKYPDRSTPIVVASGVEAYLIRAEASLHTGEENWLMLLDSLRSHAITPAMPNLSDPGTPSARVDLLYRERAMWLYLTGRRLGDIRRLVRNYQRNPETVFPTGAYPINGAMYGKATAIPFDSEEQRKVNPRFTAGCTTP